MPVKLEMSMPNQVLYMPCHEHLQLLQQHSSNEQVPVQLGHHHGWRCH